MSVSLVIDHECSQATQGSAEAQFGNAVRSYLDVGSAHIEANATCGSIALLGRVFYTAAQASANSRYLTLADELWSHPADFFTPSNGWLMTSEEVVKVVWVRDSNPDSHHHQQSVVDYMGHPENFSQLLKTSTALALLLLGSLLVCTWCHIFRMRQVRRLHRLAAQGQDQFSTGSTSIIKRRWRAANRLESESDWSSMTSQLSDDRVHKRPMQDHIAIGSPRMGSLSYASSCFDSQVSVGQVSVDTLSTGSTFPTEPDLMEAGPPLAVPEMHGSRGGEAAQRCPAAVLTRTPSPPYEV